MLDRPPVVERSILIFAIWGSLGFIGLGLFLEGLSLDLWALASAGVAAIVSAFGAHIVVNAIYRTGFTRGEAALGIAIYGILGLAFIAATLTGNMTTADYHAGLTLFATLAAGFLAYLFTRHGLRGAFSRFHTRAADTAARRDK